MRRNTKSLREVPFGYRIPRQKNSSRGWSNVHCTTVANLPVLTTGQLFLHSCLHFFGLHLSPLTIAIRVRRSDIANDSLLVNHPAAETSATPTRCTDAKPRLASTDTGSRLLKGTCDPLINRLKFTLDDSLNGRANSTSEGSASSKVKQAENARSLPPASFYALQLVCLLATMRQLAGFFF